MLAAFFMTKSEIFRFLVIIIQYLLERLKKGYKKYTQAESNRYFRLRRPALYPLSYVCMRVFAAR